MIRLRIPERDYEGLAALIALTEVQATKLYQLLASFEASESEDTLANRISDGLTVDVPLAHGMLRVLRALYSIHENEDLPVSEVVIAARNGANEAGREDLRIPDEKTLDFEARFTKLLSIESMGLVGRVRELLLERERIYCSSRIISDIRPIFARSAEDEPKAMTIMHTFRISYHAANLETEEFYLSLSSSDLASLQEIVARAIRKDNTLRGMIGRLGIPYVPSDHND